MRLRTFSSSVSVWAHTRCDHVVWRGPTQRGKSFVKNMGGWGSSAADYRIGYYLYKSRYSGSGSYGGRNRLGFIIQSARYFWPEKARAALKSGRWKKK